MSRLIDFDDGFESETVTTGGIVSASDVTVVPSGNLTSTDTQAALTELQGDIDTHTSQIATNASNTATNTANIATNTSNIATNTANIATNTANIASNTSAIATKEPAITAGTTSQYYRGDKTFQTLDKTAVGLSNVDNTSDATKNSATATLTNKTLTAPVINSGTLNSPILDVASLTEQGSTPTTPSAGTKKLYAKSDGKVYTLDSSGSEKQVGSGAGGGGAKSYYSDYDSESLTSVSMYNDGASSVPVDATGGTTTGLSVSIDSTSQLSGVTSYKFSKTATSSLLGYGFVLTTDKTLDASAKAGRTQTIQFAYKTTSNFASGDVKVFAYRVGSNTLEALNGWDGFGNYGNTLNPDTSGRGQFTSTITLGSTDTAVRLALHVASTTTQTFDIFVDSFTLGENSQVTVGSGIVGEVIAFTSSVTPSNFLKCDGSAVSRTTYAELFQVIGTSHGQGDGSTTFHLPDYRGRFLRGRAAGSANDPDRASRTAMNSGGNTGDNVGSVQGHDLASHTHDFATYYGGASNPGLPSGGETSFATNRTTLARGGNETRPVNAYVEYYIRFQKENGNTINSTQADFRVDAANVRRPFTTAFQSVPSGVYTPIGFDTAMGPNRNWTLSATSGGSYYTAPATDWYTFTAVAGFASYTGQVILGVGVNVLTDATYKMDVENGSSGLTSGAVSVYLNKGDKAYIVIYQNSGTAQNLTPYWCEASVIQRPNLSFIGNAGTPFEIKSATSAVHTPNNPSVWHPLTGNNVFLTEGVWRLNGNVLYNQSGGAPVYSYLAANFSNATGSNTSAVPTYIGNVSGATVLSAPRVTQDISINTAAGLNVFDMTLYEVVVRITTPMNVYLNCFSSQNTASFARVSANLTATRIR